MERKPKKPSKLQQEERRLETGRLLLENRMSQVQTVRHLGISDVSVAHWEQRLEAENHN